MKTIAYYRVSTEKQGETGLGLSSQKEAVRRYASKMGANLIGEYTDIQSGTKVDRDGLKKAVRHAVQSGATLLVKKLDRISRDGFKVTTMLDEMGICYLDVDSPQDNKLIKNIKFALAKDERDKISERTKSALDQIKNQIKKSGSYTTKEGNVITTLGHPETLGGKKAIERSIATRKKKASQNPANIKATGIICKLHDKGETFAAITRFLNDHGFKTSRGNVFSQVQVKKLFVRATSGIDVF